MSGSRSAIVVTGLCALLSGGVLAAACSSGPVSAVAPAATTTAVVTQTATAVASATATAIATAPPPRMVDPTAPGWIVCGEGSCEIGKEICCLGDKPSCVPIPAEPDAYGGPLFAMWQACRFREFMQCDDAGDCGVGQVCCQERDLGAEGATLDHRSCLPLRDGKVDCHFAEQCSPANEACSRKGTVCGAPDENRARECAVPESARYKPPCPKGPCAAGLACVRAEGGLRCEPREGRFVPDLVECSLGRQCSEDQSCFKYPSANGTRCDYNLRGVDDLTEPALCDSVADCKAYCRGDPSMVPHCFKGSGPSGEVGSAFCECLLPCTKDTDCPENCFRLALHRSQDSSELERRCDKKIHACDCRPTKK